MFLSRTVVDEVLRAVVEVLRLNGGGVVQRQSGLSAGRSDAGCRLCQGTLS